MYRLACLASVAMAMKLGEYTRYDPNVSFKNDVKLELDNGVIVMNKDNFNDVVDAFSPLLIHFYYTHK